MSTDTEPRRDDGLSDPPRGSYRVLGTVPGCDLPCMLDGAWADRLDAQTHAGIASTQFDVFGAMVVFDAYTAPDEEF